MFRYFGFSWDPAHAEQAAFAQRVDVTMHVASGWQLAFSGLGMRVYTIGSLKGVNGIYPLPLGRGVILGRLFRRRGGSTETSDLQLSPGEGGRILATDGQVMTEEYWGRYTAVIQSDKRGACLLRGPGSTLPCFLRHVEGVAIFFSWLEDALAFAFDATAPRVDWEAIAALTLLGHLDGPQTALAGVSQILPGRLTPLCDSASRPVTFWSVADIARKPTELEHEFAAAQLKRVVTDCVHAWSSCYEAILLRLSGGFDSAVLLSCLSDQASERRITCLNYYSAGSDSDERSFARLAAERSCAQLIERERDAAFRLTSVLAASAMPVPPSYIGRMDASRIDAEVAAGHHAPVMFTGGGGDQVFFQRKCSWPAADYLSIHGLGPGFVRACLDAARLSHVSLWQSMRSALADQARRSLRSEGIGQFFTLGRRDALEDMRDVDRFIHPDLVSAADLPIGKYHHAQDLVDPAGYYDPYLPATAPELVRPLLSQPLVELCLALPTWLLSHGGRSRALARHAFAHDIPREIATRQSKGGMDEHVSAILHRDLPLARELLLDGHLVSAGLLDRCGIEAALAGRVSALDTHANEIHHYIAIEAWLRKFAQARGH